MKIHKFSKSEMVIPDDVQVSDMLSEIFLTKIPYYFFPNDREDEIEGIYVADYDIPKLLRANKNNPTAIQYIADMIE